MIGKHPRESGLATSDIPGYSYVHLYKQLIGYGFKITTSFRKFVNNYDNKTILFQSAAGMLLCFVG